MFKLYFLFAVVFSQLAASPFQPAKYIWSLGFASDCNVTFSESKDPATYINPKKIKEGDVIWVQSHFIPKFAKEFLPHIKNRFILVTTDGDEAFATSFEKEMDVEAFIKNDKIIRIFAQNCDYPGHEKVTPIPIGLDFHTLARKGGSFKERRQSPEKQQSILDGIVATLQPTHLRKKRALVDFHLHDTIKDGGRASKLGEDRTAIYHKILPSGVVDGLERKIRRRDLWAKKGEYAFSIAPQGNGMDTHRLWEDLILGCIVIVKTSPLDPLYQGLPVVIVKDWSEVTAANLEIWIKKYGDALTNQDYRKKLTHRYWMDQILQQKPGNDYDDGLMEKL